MPDTSGRSLRRWQTEALERWRAASYRGIVGAVTGGGKTVFALACIADRRPETTLVVVPTAALLEQWWEETSDFFAIPLGDIAILASRPKLRRGTINIGVLNTAAKLQPVPTGRDLMLVVDECHKAASPVFRSVLNLGARASLGLSATPERPYDEGLKEVLEPGLGPVLYQYDYAAALSDGVIVPFDLMNVVFDLEPEVQAEYAKLTKMIARSIDRLGPEAPESVALYLRRSRVLNGSPRRVELAVRLVQMNRGRRIIIFHEDIDACEALAMILTETGHRADVYHSRQPTRKRAEVLKQFRSGILEVLVTCRALDEGFNVPEAEIGVIAASTATRRQRIQRLGRVLRPAKGKGKATVFTLVASEAEMVRLKEEESELQGVAAVSWARA